jgi:hypothetical protein
VYIPRISPLQYWLFTLELQWQSRGQGRISQGGVIYQPIAVWFTNWENHRTQTEYDDALIVRSSSLPPPASSLHDPRPARNKK